MTVYATGWERYKKEYRILDKQIFTCDTKDFIESNYFLRKQHQSCGTCKRVNGKQNGSTVSSRSFTYMFLLLSLPRIHLRTLLQLKFFQCLQDMLLSIMSTALYIMC